MQKKKEILERANNKPNYSITHDMTNIYTEAFSIFFKIGAFTIGGGYAMVPLIEDEIVTKRRWIAKEDFIDLLAIAQSAPGILAVNISIFIGYRLRGIRGSIVTALGTILPSFLIILAIALFFHNFKDNVYVERIFKGIRPAVVALILSVWPNPPKSTATRYGFLLSRLCLSGYWASPPSGLSLLPV
jgi:chromate transporter